MFESLIGAGGGTGREGESIKRLLERIYLLVGFSNNLGE